MCFDQQENPKFQLFSHLWVDVFIKIDFPPFLLSAVESNSKFFIQYFYSIEQIIVNHHLTHFISFFFLFHFFIVFDVSHGNFQVVLSNQFLVRPNGQQGEKEQNNKKDKTNTPETATSAAPTNADTSAPSAPEFSFAETVLQKVGKPLKDVIEQVRIKRALLLVFSIVFISSNKSYLCVCGRKKDIEKITAKKTILIQ